MSSAVICFRWAKGRSENAIQSEIIIIIIIIIINEKINVALSCRTARTRNSHKNTSRENVVSNSTEEEKIVMKITARRAVSSAAA